MEREPSVLDYLKALLTPWRGPAPRIPPAEGASQSPATGTDPGNGGSLAGVEVGVLASRDLDEWQQPGAMVAPAAQPSPAVWPWWSLAALFLALLAQRSMEPPDRSLTLGVVLYALGVGLVVFANWRGEWVLASWRAQAPRAGLMTVRYYALLISFILGALAFLTFVDNRFNFLNLTLWLLSVGYLVRAFWATDPQAASWRHRMRLVWQDPHWNLRISPFTLALAAGIVLVVFFRLHRLAEVPPEMFSDHAEKLMDVANVLRGETHIFFPRNTGREAFQMYLTATVARLFNTGLSFMSLKLGTTIAGLLTLPFLYLLGKEIANRRVGLLAMVLAGIAYWPNVITRVALRFTLYPFFFAPTFYFLVRGLRRMNRNDFILAGIALGLGLHGYSSFRIAPLVVVAAVALFLLHRQSASARQGAIWGLMLVAVVSFFIFLPLFRYALEDPQNFSYRTLTRLGSAERPLSGPVWQIFLQNLWGASTMFFWSNGDVWVHSVVDRPALDVVSAALFALGVALLLVRYLRSRDWLDLFLLVSVPLLLLSSVLSLAFPEENPSLNRTGGAIIPVFLIVALALDGLMSAFKSRLDARWGPRLAWGAVVLLLGWASLQNYDLVFNQYYRQFQLGAWNSTEIGHVIRGFADSVGSRDTAWVVPFPHWVDTRLVGIEAGYPEKDYALFPDQLQDTLAIPETKLFLIKPEDQATVAELQRLYPQGSLRVYNSRIEGKDFLLYLVPAKGN